MKTWHFITSLLSCRPFGVWIEIVCTTQTAGLKSKSFLQKGCPIIAMSSQAKKKHWTTLPNSAISPQFGITETFSLVDSRLSSHHVMGKICTRSRTLRRISPSTGFHISYIWDRAAMHTYSVPWGAAQPVHPMDANWMPPLGSSHGLISKIHRKLIDYSLNPCCYTTVGFWAWWCCRLGDSMKKCPAIEEFWSEVASVLSDVVGSVVLVTLGLLLLCDLSQMQRPLLPSKLLLTGLTATKTTILHSWIDPDPLWPVTFQTLSESLLEWSWP